MTKLEKCEFFYNLGFTYNAETGYVISHKGKVLTNTDIRWKRSPGSKIDLKYKNEVMLSKVIYAWYYVHKTIPKGPIKHIDGNKSNNKMENLVEMIRKLPIEYYLKYKEKQKLIKKVVDKKVDKKINKRYIKDNELIYYIIISKGKGYLVPEAQELLMKIPVELSRKFRVKNFDDRHDYIQEAYYHILKSWMNFDEIKYSSAFVYYTEISKRAMAKAYNNIKGFNKINVTWL